MQVWEKRNVPPTVRKQLSPPMVHSYTLHLTDIDRNRFIEEWWKQVHQPNASQQGKNIGPSLVDPTLIEVSLALFRKIKRTKYGLRVTNLPKGSS